jgi:nitrile hydratase
VDGVHDIGGVDGFGAVDAPPSEPVFAEPWERRAFRVSMATLGAVRAPGGRFRHSIERMEPSHYLSSSYYEHWLTGIATLLVETGLTTSADLNRRAEGRFPLSRPDRGRPPARPAADRTTPRFAIGDHVRVRAWHPPGHTRAPRYIQGRRGVITRHDGAFNVPDIEAHGGGFIREPTYSVRFTARELWGEGGEEGVTINVDLWETYLEDGHD